VHKKIRIVAAVVLAALAATAYSQAAEEPQPASFVSLKFEGSCGGENRRLWLANSHTFKTVSTTVRWRAVGGKNLTEQFFAGPNTLREVGCAAEAEIVTAQFADF
jgi:hypothetical protein